jgi:crossover junction endodeoxyribonuclease RusA
VGNGILIESSKRVGPWRAVVALTVGEQTTSVLDGPVRIELQFVMPRPKATPKRSTPPAVKKPDLDKLTRAVLDAITGVSYRDDSQVVDLVASKRIAELGEPPGLALTVCPCSIHIQETP